MKRGTVLGLIAGLSGLPIALSAFQAPPPGPSAAALAVTTIEKVKDNLYVITGSSPVPRETFSGGNTGVFITARGVVLVDTKLAGWGPTLLERIRTVTDKPVVTVINTHSHGDHTGGNEFFGATVESVVQENTKANMARMDAFKGEKAAFLPKRTFTDKLTLGAGKDRIDLYHFGAGHTNGDTFVVYPALRTMQAGDMFPWKDAPFIDRNNGGSGVLWPQSLKRVLDGVKNVDTVIGGHQPVATWKDLQVFQQFTADLLTETTAAQKAGKTVEQAVASKEWMSKYPGYNSTRLQAATQAIYDELSGKPPAPPVPAPTPPRYPAFEPDPSWPKLPNDWVVGNVSKVVVDSHQNVWFIHRPRTVPAGKKSAPAVVELDAAGNFVQAWGGPAAGYDWPDAEHNIFVDHKDNVWITGSSPSGQSQTQWSDDMVLKFDNKGKLLKQLGGRSANVGSKDPTSVNKPGDIFVYPKTNELFAADGYGNRRLIVFDADTFAFKRMWSAFGNTPQDEPGRSGGRGANGGNLVIPDPNARPAAPGAAASPAPAPVLDTEGPGSPLFVGPVHGVVVADDDLLYVADRSARRVQEFTVQGTYKRQVFINRAGPSIGSASGFALSPDKDQEFLYVSDYGNSRVVVVDRKKLTVVYQFGTRGTAPGQFQGIHHIAVDAKGNLYAAEVAPGARLQKFTFKGVSATLPANALTEAQLAAKP